MSEINTVRKMTTALNESRKTNDGIASAQVKMARLASSVIQ